MLHTQITCLKSFRIGAFFATGLLATFLTLFIFPTANMDDTRATNTLSETTLSMTTSDVVLDFTPTDLNGSFASSTPAEFSVTTNNYSGYSLSIAAAENNANNSKLINGNYYLNSISQASIETDFTNGTWGYKPSLINSQANTNYLPAPSYAGDTLDVTNSANNNNEANTYSIELGMKADFTTPSGAYSNTFVISAIANAVGFQITYDKNTEDTVTNMPESITGDVSATDVFISNTTPQRENYIFMKWYDEDKDLEFQPGDAIDLTQLENTNYFHLKAIWRKVAYLDTGSNVNVKLKKLGGNTGNVYIATTNNTIKEIQMADSLPADFVPSTDNTISIATSPNPIYAWFDNTDGKGIIYLYANDADVIANWNSGYMFSYMQSLANIDGITNWDTSKVTDMSGMFQGVTALTNIDGATNWDTSNVTNMQNMFQGASSLTNIDGATNWNTSNVTNISSMFSGTKITNIDALATGTRPGNDYVSWVSLLKGL